MKDKEVMDLIDAIIDMSAALQVMTIKMSKIHEKTMNLLAEKENKVELKVIKFPSAN